MKELIKIEHITKNFGNLRVLDDFSLTVHENEFITLLGPSGCGKTTILRILGGFETADEGKIFFEGEDITDLPANKRNLNTVFQKYALFPHMNVKANIAFGLKINGKTQKYIDDKVDYALNLVNLKGFENRSIDKLSGGQQQRIAMARAIVNEPKVLLLDEPLGALDLKLRQEMQYELIRLKKELGITFIYVTHDQEEALTMSDKVIVINDGYIQQMGTPEGIYNEPENAFVADFIGDSNIIDGTMIKDRLVKLNGQEFPCIDEGFGNNKSVDVVIRPEDIIVRELGAGKINGTVLTRVFIGVHYEMLVKSEENEYEWLVQCYEKYDIGAKVSLDVIPSNIQIMNKPTSSDEEAIDLDI